MTLFCDKDIIVTYLKINVSLLTAYSYAPSFNKCLAKNVNDFLTSDK